MRHWSPSRWMISDRSISFSFFKKLFQISKLTIRKKISSFIKCTIYNSLADECTKCKHIVVIDSFGNSAFYFFFIVVVVHFQICFQESFKTKKQILKVLIQPFIPIAFWTFVNQDTRTTKVVLLSRDQQAYRTSQKVLTFFNSGEMPFMFDPPKAFFLTFLNYWDF